MTNTNKLSIPIPALKRPTLEQLMKKERGWITKIVRDTSTEDATVFTFATVLEGEERYINGTEYQKRIPKHALGFQHMQWLTEHQDEFPDFMALLGKVYIDFPGLEVLDVDVDRYYPYLYKGGKRWDRSWGWVDYGFSPRGRVAVSASSKDAQTPSFSALVPLETRLSELEKKMEKVERVIRLPEPWTPNL